MSVMTEVQNKSDKSWQDESKASLIKMNNLAPMGITVRTGRELRQNEQPYENNVGPITDRSKSSMHLLEKVM